MVKTVSKNVEEKPKHQKVSTFLRKTYELLNNPESHESIRWAPSGIGFIILDQSLFSKTVLPKYFRHSNYSSFVRQLNMYNFHKIRENASHNYFFHKHFNLQNQDQLSQIKRKPEKKKKKNNQSDFQNSSLQSMSQKIHRITKHFNKVTLDSGKEMAQSQKQLQSQKNTQNVFESELNCSIVNIPVSQSSNQLSMQIDEQVRSERHMPGVPTKQLINASKNNLFPLMSLENVMSIFF